MYFPAGMNMYWVFTASFNLATLLLSQSAMFKRFHNVGDYLPGTMNQKLVERRQELEAEAEAARARRLQDRLNAKTRALNAEKEGAAAPPAEKVKEHIDLPSGSAVFAAASPFKKDEASDEGAKDQTKSRENEQHSRVSKDKETESATAKAKLVAEGEKLKVTTVGGKSPKEFVVYTNRPTKNKNRG